MANKVESGYSLADVDVIPLAKQLFGAGLIKEEVLVTTLTNLSSQVSNSAKHRCLFTHVSKVTNNNKEALLRLAEILIQFQPTFMPITDDTVLLTEHIPDLVRILARYAFKWELIGTSLRFQPQDLHGIQHNYSWRNYSSEYRLLQLFELWIERRYSYTLSPTLKSLDQALNSELVGLGATAMEIRRVVSTDVVDRTAKPFQPLPYVVSSVVLQLIEKHYYQKSSTYVVKDELKCQNMQHVEGKEYEPIVLEVQATSNEAMQIERLEYQWEAEHSLPSMSSLPILCVPQLDIGMDGCQHLCRVTYYYYTEPQKKEVATHVVETNALRTYVSCPLDSSRTELITLYLAQPEVPKDTWPPVGSKKYINLALIKQDTADYRKKITQLTVRGDIDDILKDKEMIEYKGLLQNLKKNNVLLIEGRPGSGKTTLVHKITHDWATSPQEYSKTIRLLLLVSLRVLNTLMKPNIELLDILQLFNGVNLSKELIEEREGYGVCFIFDGLDEFSPLDGEKSVIYRIIKKEYLAKSIVIVASRPVATAHLRSRATKVIEVVGFLRDQIFEYFSDYPFSETSKPAELNKYLLIHPNILHICYLPIHAVMVAYLFEVKGEVPRTETEIYRHFTLLTVMRSISKNSEIDKITVDMQSLSERQEYKEICQLALEKTISNEQVLTQKEIKQETCLGLISVDRTADLYGYVNVYTFLHLTFQEYLAACHISSLNYEQQTKIIEEHGGKSHMLVVWKFFCGLAKFDSDNRFQLILQKTTGQLFHIQCAYETQELTACTQVLEKVNYCIDVMHQQSMSVPDFTAIGYVTSKSMLLIKLNIVDSILSSETMNALAAELKENENFETLKVVQSLNSEALNGFVTVLSHCQNLKELDISNNGITDSDATILSNGLQHCENLEKICIANNKMTSAGVNISLKGIKKFKYVSERITGFCSHPLLQSCKKYKLEIHNKDLHQKECSTEADICYAATNGTYMTSLMLVKLPMHSTIYGFTKNYTYLQSLSIKHSEMHADDIRCLADGLSHCCNLQILDLSENSIGDADFFSNINSCICVEELSLQSNNIECKVQVSSWFKSFKKLQKLDLSNNKLQKGGAKVLASSLCYCPDLMTLNLDDNAIGTAGVMAILKHLKNLEELHLRNNRIGSEGAKALSSHLQLHCNPHTYRLSLRGNEIGGDGIEAIAQSLIQCPNLEEIDLSNNNVGVTGVTLIMKSVKSCANIKSLYLNSCKIADEGIKVLLSHLPNHPALQKLSLMNNSIGRNGVKALAESCNKCQNLQMLNLSTNKFESAEVEILCLGLKNCPSLAELHLADNNIDDHGVQALSCFLHNSRIEGLDLSNNTIAEPGAKLLADSLKHCTKLKWLNLSKNLLNRKSALEVISSINNCPSFNKLILTSKRITDPQSLSAELQKGSLVYDDIMQNKDQRKEKACSHHSKQDHSIPDQYQHRLKARQALKWRPYSPLALTRAQIRNSLQQDQSEKDK